jgi:hypothetical protein
MTQRRPLLERLKLPQSQVAQPPVTGQEAIEPQVAEGPALSIPSLPAAIAEGFQAAERALRSEGVEEIRLGGDETAITKIGVKIAGEWHEPPTFRQGYRDLLTRQPLTAREFERELTTKVRDRLFEPLKAAREQQAAALLQTAADTVETALRESHGVTALELKTPAGAPLSANGFEVTLEGGEKVHGSLHGIHALESRGLGQVSIASLDLLTSKLVEDIARQLDSHSAERARQKQLVPRFTTVLRGEDGLAEVGAVSLAPAPLKGSSHRNVEADVQLADGTRTRLMVSVRVERPAGMSMEAVPAGEMEDELRRGIAEWLRPVVFDGPLHPEDAVLVRQLSERARSKGVQWDLRPGGEMPPLNQRELTQLFKTIDVLDLVSAIAGKTETPMHFKLGIQGWELLFGLLESNRGQDPDLDDYIDELEPAMAQRVRSGLEPYRALRSLGFKFPDDQARPELSALFEPVAPAGSNAAARDELFGSAASVPSAWEHLLPKGEEGPTSSGTKVLLESSTLLPPAAATYDDASRLGRQGFPAGSRIPLWTSIWLNEDRSYLIIDPTDDSRYPVLRGGGVAVESTDAGGKKLTLIDESDQPLKIENAAWVETRLDALVPDPTTRALLADAGFDPERETHLLAIKTQDAGEPPTYLAIQKDQIVSICDQVSVMDMIGDRRVTVRKPVIYLYPESTQVVQVRVELEGEFTAQYPKAQAGGWRMLASPDGQLTDPVSKKRYPYLFWEGTRMRRFGLPPEECYCIAGPEALAFLEHLAERHAFNDRERTDFVSYWLPAMERNRFNLIRLVGEEYETYARMTVEPRPETTLRVFIAFRGLQAAVPTGSPDVPQRHRRGFTVVEWGGVNLDE